MVIKMTIIYGKEVASEPLGMTAWVQELQPLQLCVGTLCSYFVVILPHFFEVNVSF